MSSYEPLMPTRPIMDEDPLDAQGRPHGHGDRRISLLMAMPQNRLTHAEVVVCEVWCPVDVAHLPGMADDCSLPNLVAVGLVSCDVAHLPGMDELCDRYAVSCLAGIEFGCLSGHCRLMFLRSAHNADLPKSVCILPD
ncbi:hypothetical protein Nepgr_009400 [Nepenthes gracilis]|uniref:Uncharacterized protein n=1 Tax=Nepenthes gracilis TaxID=150966 RepID=A0AAD3XKB2_NEPGR|nr:hypothetical protein Nepgr_009400 [Nepenthes gracilis]